MKEYVEKDLVRRVIESPRSKEQMINILRGLPIMPIADAKQIVHGSWEVHRFIPENSNSGITYTKCSICGNLPMLNPYSKEEELTSFCPYCGADMRGEKND